MNGKLRHINRRKEAKAKEKEKWGEDFEAVFEEIRVFVNSLTERGIVIPKSLADKSWSIDGTGSDLQKILDELHQFEKGQESKEGQ